MTAPFTRRALLGLVLCLPAAGQQVWTPPVLGYFYDATVKGIRPIAGVPGAASLEDSLPLGLKLQRAYISPSRKYAIAVTDESVLLVTLAQRAHSIAALADMPLDIIAAFSPAGDTAVLYSPVVGAAQVWTGMPGAPSLKSGVRLGSVSRIAVSDDGDVVVGAGETALVLAGGEPRLLPVSGTFSDLAFLPASHDLVAAGRDASSLTLVRSADGEIEASQLAGAAEGLAQPASLAVSESGAKVLVAGRDTGSLVAVDLLSRRSAALGCDCKPSGVARAQGNAVFHLVDGEARLLLVDLDQDEPRTSFVNELGGAR